MINRPLAPIAGHAARFCLTVLAAVWLGGARADEPAPAVAARVEGKEILAADVDRLVAVALSRRTAEGEALELLKAQALASIVNQLLVERACTRLGLAVSDEEAAAARDQLRQQLAARGGSLDDLLRQRQIDEPRLLQELRGQLLLQKYAASQITPERLNQYFTAHRSELDGSRMRVSHLVLRPGGSSKLEPLLAKAQQLKERIESGEFDFAEAARRYSAGPSRHRGGELGWIDRQTPWQPAFIEAALRLSAGQISPPVVTPFGVHLVRCDEITPGNKSLGDVAGVVQQRLATELLAELAASERLQTKIEYTGLVSYLDPVNGRLVPATPPAGKPSAQPKTP